MPKSFLLILCAGFIWAKRAEAHGEDKLGPNGGYIRMPGAFHTEIVRESGNKFKVYLLDIDWKNPTTKDSTVKLSWKDSTIETAKCKAKRNFYVCSFQKEIKVINSGQIIVEATRESQVGNQVSYQIPFK